MMGGCVPCGLGAAASEPECYSEALGSQLDACVAAADSGRTLSPFCKRYIDDDAYGSALECLPDCETGDRPEGCGMQVPTWAWVVGGVVVVGVIVVVVRSM